VRTRVGYCGGTSAEPTYRDLGDHTETVQIDYDPERITYAELLEVFWKEHDPARRPSCRQYAAFVFVHDEEQERLARESRRSLGRPVFTEIRTAARFWRAEDYHQKYRLRRDPERTAALAAHFGSDRAMVDSTAAARLNGLNGGFGDRTAVEAELRRLGLPEALIPASTR